jgi:hypothetical protein
MGGTVPAFNDEKKFDYKNFPIRKKQDFSLYAIVPPQGKQIHKTLEGDFSQLRTRGFL